MTHITIIGAGVIGLQTSITLLEAGFKVTIIAKHFPGDESIEAGAVWRTHATSDQIEQCQWDLESYRNWMEIVEKSPDKAVEMGIERRVMHIYSLTPEIDTSSPSLWYTPHMQNFSTLPPEELPPGCNSGISMDSIAINPPRYLAYLFSQVQKLGACIIRAELPPSDGFPKAIETAINLSSEVESHFKEESRDSSTPAIINCIGLGALSLCSDNHLYPIRGQTVLVRLHPHPPPSSLKIIMHHSTNPTGGVTYIVPRPHTNTFILGGTKTSDSWDSEPDSEVTEGIIERCKIGWPVLKDVEIEVLSVQVGLRPGRKGGARVEIEMVDVGDGRQMSVVHEYGHAGAGYQNSIGSAGKVLGLVRGIRRVIAVV